MAGSGQCVDGGGVAPTGSPTDATDPPDTTPGATGETTEPSGTGATTEDPGYVKSLNMCCFVARLVVIRYF